VTKAQENNAVPYPKFLTHVKSALLFLEEASSVSNVLESNVQIVNNITLPEAKLDLQLLG
jgi:hypothetical protein